MELRIVPVHGLARLDAAEAAGVGFQHTGIDGEALAADETGGHAGVHHLLEYQTEHVALAKPTVAVLRERRVIGNGAFQPEPAEPAIGQIEMHLVAEPPLGADAEAVADQQHPDHQLRIDRGPPVLAVKRRQRLVQKAQIEYSIDATQKMIRGKVAFQAERIKQLLLKTPKPAHHRSFSVANTPQRTESQDATAYNTDFFNSIRQVRRLPMAGSGREFVRDVMISGLGTRRRRLCGGQALGTELSVFLRWIENDRVARWSLS